MDCVPGKSAAMEIENRVMVRSLRQVLHLWVLHKCSLPRTSATGYACIQENDDLSEMFRHNCSHKPELPSL
jgi:hypothetical protein